MSPFTLRALVRDLSEQEVRSIRARWAESREVAGGEQLARPRVVAQLADQMGDEERVQTRLKELPEKLAGLVEGLLEAPDHAGDLRGIHQAHGEAFRSRYELEASLVALTREGFVFPARRREQDETRYAIPGELASCIRALRRRQQVELRGTLSLKGFLHARYYSGERAAGDAPTEDGDGLSAQARRVYKIYLMESSIKSRVQGLPDGVRRVFERVLGTYGGIMPVTELGRVAGDEDVDVDVDLVKKCLEDAMLGTVAPLRLARFGLEPVERAVVVFYEIALARLQTWGDDHGEPQIDEAISAGVDLLTNVGRFLRDVANTKVQFTVEGQLYKASARRIVKGFLQMPGGYMPPETQARFIYAFTRSRRLIERSGERALRLSSGGLDFEHHTLHEKLNALLAFSVEERAPQGEHFHQVRLRRILLRLLRRLEPEQWYEALFVPFLARNGYLGKLDELRVEEFFAARFKGGGYVPTETVQQICLHLLDFVKRRLYPLGLVDLGLREGRPVAIRLSRLGAELLGAVDANEVGGHRSSVVVNPDFELILFPGEDEHEAVHALDQFCERLKTDHIHHFRISRQSVQSALHEGVALSHIIQELSDRSRAPLPQNVVFSLEDWGDQAGVLVLDEDMVLTGRRAEVVERFASHPRLAEQVTGRKGDCALRLDPDVRFDELRDLARDLGFLIERRSEPDGDERDGR